MGRKTKLREITKRNIANVRKGKQATLPVEPVKAERREPRIISSAEIKHYYKLALAEEWGCKYENLKIYGWAEKPIIAYKKPKHVASSHDLLTVSA